MKANQEYNIRKYKDIPDTLQSRNYSKKYKK